VEVAAGGGGKGGICAIENNESPLKIPHGIHNVDVRGPLLLLRAWRLPPPGGVCTGLPHRIRRWGGGFIL